MWMGGYVEGLRIEDASTFTTGDSSNHLTSSTTSTSGDSPMAGIRNSAASIRVVAGACVTGVGYSSEVSPRTRSISQVHVQAVGVTIVDL